MTPLVLLASGLNPAATHLPPTKQSRECKDTVDQMVAAMRNMIGMGLAAPQIAVNKQVRRPVSIVLHVAHDCIAVPFRRLQLFVMEITRRHIQLERYRDTDKLMITELPLRGAWRMMCCCPMPTLSSCSPTCSPPPTKPAVANPKVTLMGKKVIHREGCLSLPDFSAHVPRYTAAVVSRRQMIEGLTGSHRRRTSCLARGYRRHDG